MVWINDLLDWGVAAGGGEVQWWQDGETVGEILAKIFGMNFNIQMVTKDSQTAGEKLNVSLVLLGNKSCFRAILSPQLASPSNAMKEIKNLACSFLPSLFFTARPTSTASVSKYITQDKIIHQVIL